MRRRPRSVVRRSEPPRRAEAGGFRTRGWPKLPAAMKIPTLEQFRTNRSVLFWGLHAAGWAAYGITQYFGALLYEKPASYARVIAVSAMAGFVLSMPMRYIYRRLWSRPPRIMILGVLATCYITALALRVVINLSYKSFVEAGLAGACAVRVLRRCAVHDLPAAVLERLYFGIKYYESQRKQEEALLAVALAQEAQLKMLRYQLNPHFLFNTLNAISTLILDNENRTANQAVMRLSEFLRYTLDQDPMKKVTLAPGNRGDEPVSQHREAALRRAPAPGVRHRGAGPGCAGAEPAAAAADRERGQVRGVAARAGRHGPRRRPRTRELAGAVACRRRSGSARGPRPGASAAASACATPASGSRCSTARTTASPCSTSQARAAHGHGAAAGESPSRAASRPGNAPTSRQHLARGAHAEDPHLLVDDEALSRRGLELRLRGATDIEIVAECTNGREALAAIRSTSRTWCSSTSRCRACRASTCSRTCRRSCR